MLLFVFHLNNNECTKAKVKPPRLNGKKLGLFATRCPYRPVPMGLTLAKVESIQDATVYLSGVDIINGTPILDIKPYIAEYDQPAMTRLPAVIDSHNDVLVANQGLTDNDNVDEVQDSDSVRAAQWLDDCHKESTISRVEFTPRALEGLAKFGHDIDSDYKLSLFTTSSEAKITITDVLLGDPRSAYRRQSCTDRLYYFTVDSMHITCWFDDCVAEVLKVQPICRAEALTKHGQS